jgi:hypothetical protein
MAKYFYFEVDENGDRTIRINWEELNKLKDAEKGEEASEFYDEASKILEEIYDAADAIEDATDAINEELQKGRDEYLELE